MLAASALIITSPASAEPSIEQVQAQVLELEHKAEAAAEKYNDAQGRLNDVEGKLAGLKDRLQRERRELGDLQGTVGQFARATYVNGGVDTSLQVILAEDPAEFLAQAAALDQVARSQATALRKSQTARLRLAQTEAAVSEQEAAAQGVRDEMKSLKAEADKNLSEAEGVLAQLKQEERDRIAAAQAAARQQSIDEARAAAAAVSASSGGGGGGGGSDGGGGGGGGYSGGSRAAQAVQYALNQVGDGYIVAATGPNYYDCSGLTMMAWRQAGVSLPHYSYAQYGQSRKISLNEAQPGDLVFFFRNGAHHVGMYIGNGKMVHAANPSSGVLISDVMGSWYRDHFSGVGRVVG